MVIGQTYSTDTFDITITGFDFSEKAENPNGDNHLAPGDGRVTANVYYNIKFTGKAQSPGSVFAPESLRYGDGYVFDPVEFWFYKERSDGWLNIGDVQPLDPEFPCKACFFVPEEVEEEKGNPLSVVFTEDLSYSPRPESEERKEVAYHYAAELVASDRWSEAKLGRSLLSELDGYKDSDALIMASRFQFFTYEDREFFREYVDDMEPMSGEAVKALLTDATFSMRNNYGGDGDGTHTITFHGDGTLDAAYTAEGKEYTMYQSWRLEGGNVVCTNSFTNRYGEYTTVDYSFITYQYDETTYLLIDQAGDYSMVLFAR